MPKMLLTALTQQIRREGEVFGQERIANAAKILRELRQEIGEENFKQWVQRAFILVQSEEILFFEMCKQCSWEGKDKERDSKCKDKQTESKKKCTCFTLQHLRENGLYRSTSQRQESIEQLAGKLDTFVQELSCQATPTESFLQCLWQSGESKESLHETLSAVTKREISPIETAPWQTAAGNAESGIGADDREGTGGLILDDQGGQQINVRTDGKSPTLRAEMHGNVPCVLMDAYQHHGWREGETCGTLTAESNNHVRGDTPLVIEQAAGFKAGQSKAGSIGWQDETAATLSAQASGTEPTVCIKKQYLFENHSQDTRFKGPLKVCPMLPAQLGTGGNNTPFVVEGSPVYCLQGNGIDGALTAGCNGKGWKEGQCYTLNTIDRPAIAYAVGNGQANQVYLQDKTGALNCMHDQQAIVLDRAFFNQGQNAQYKPQFYADGTCPTLVAKGPHAVQVRYIVRRLTPTECARLQGFPDKWGHPDKKETLTDDEYRFWLEVRNTHAAINGKAVKEYTKEQMLIWYNKLHSDSAEYKMWGNGIALPCALYVMQGIVEPMKC